MRTSPPIAGSASSRGSATLEGEDLDRFVVGVREPAREALGRLRQNGHGLAVVVGEGGVIVGTLTDSDIRRAVLRGHSLDDPVTGIMPPMPLLATTDATEQELEELLLTHRVRSIPVVEGNRLVGVHHLQGFSSGQPAPTALIMAGGRGLRLRPVTDKVPKPLLRLGSMSIVERLVAAMVLAGVADVFLAVNYMAEAFEQRLGSGEALGVRLHYLREETAMGTAGALHMLPAPPPGPLLVSNGDIVTTVDFSRLLEFHWRFGGAVTVCGVEHRSPIPYGVLRVAQHHLLEIEEKPERRDLCSAGIYVLNPEVLRLVAPDTPLDMPDLIARVLAEGLPVHVFPIVEKWFDIGGTAEFERILVQFATGEED